jgi:hypothetical protein
MPTGLSIVALRVKTKAEFWPNSLTKTILLLIVNRGGITYENQIYYSRFSDCYS